MNNVQQELSYNQSVKVTSTDIFQYIEPCDLYKYVHEEIVAAIWATVYSKGYCSGEVSQTTAN